VVLFDYKTAFPWQLRALSASIEKSADVLIATSFSLPIAPDIPDIQVVHDLIYPLHPEWQPTMADLRERHPPVFFEMFEHLVKPNARQLARSYPGPWVDMPRNPWDEGVGEIFKLVFSRAILRAKQVVVVSRYVGELVSRWYPTVATPRLVSPVNPFAAVDHAHLEAGTAEGTSGQLLYVATYEQRKNHSLLLKAAKIASARHDNSVRVVLVGREHYKSHFAAISSLIQQESLTLPVITKQSVSAAELIDLYRSSAALAFPSLEEGFGLPLLEAMSLGVPIASLDLPTTREVCGGTPAYARDASPAEFAEAIGRSLSDGTSRIERHARTTRLQDQFSLGNVGTQICSALEAVGA
jgi:glycosyltransferase involved in cell wall biosynthesis